VKNPNFDGQNGSLLSKYYIKGLWSPFSSRSPGDFDDIVATRSTIK